jgi:hypothetical protein
LIAGTIPRSEVVVPNVLIRALSFLIRLRILGIPPRFLVIFTDWVASAASDKASVANGSKRVNEANILKQAEPLNKTGQDLRRHSAVYICCLERRDMGWLIAPSGTMSRLAIENLE